MFIIKCSECGNEQEWKTGVDVTKSVILYADDIVICDCGNSVVRGENTFYFKRLDE